MDNRSAFLASPLVFYCRYRVARDPGIKYFAWLFYLYIRKWCAVVLCDWCSDDLVCRGCKNEGASSVHSCSLVWGAELLEILRCAPWLLWLLPSPVVSACLPQDLDNTISLTWIQRKKLTVRRHSISMFILLPLFENKDLLSWGQYLVLRYPVPLLKQPI